MTDLERYLAAYAERYGRTPRRTPEFHEPLPPQVTPFPGAGAPTSPMPTG